MSTSPSTPAKPTGEALARLREALHAYEVALAAHDVDALNSWFLDSPGTLRADASSVLVGHDTIAAFRSRAQPAVRREVVRQHVVPLSAEAALTMAETRRDDATTGLQTQAWILTDGGWRIAAAHVSVTPHKAPDSEATKHSAETTPTIDTTLWRELGDPLVPALGPGPLNGLSVAVKDLFDVAGHRVGAGNPHWLAQATPAAEHAAVVRMLLEAGARVQGIAQTDEFAYSLSGDNIHYGTPTNPVARGRLPGGSSSGSASAVASGAVDIGLGSDTAGSIRVPAAYCGIYGLRTGHGSVPTRGVMPLAPSFDSVGWLTRDAATMLRVSSELLPHSEVPPPTTLLLPDDLMELAEPAVAEQARRAAEQVADQLGLPLERPTAVCDGHIEEWVRAFQAVQAAEAWGVHGRWLRDRLDVLAPDIAGRFAVGRDLSALKRAEAEQVILAARIALRRVVSPGTVLLQPAASTVAPRQNMADEEKAVMRAGTLRLTLIASVSGLPALTVPAGSVDGLPVGLCLVGTRGSDLATASLASRVRIR